MIVADLQHRCCMNPYLQQRRCKNVIRSFIFLVRKISRKKNGASSSWSRSTYSGIRNVWDTLMLISMPDFRMNGNSIWFWLLFRNSMVISSRTLFKASMNTLLEEEMEMEAAKSQQQNCQDLHMPKKQRIPILFSLFFFSV